VLVGREQAFGVLLPPPTSFTGICRKEGLFVESRAPLLSTNKPSLRQIVVKEVVRGRRGEAVLRPRTTSFTTL